MQKSPTNHANERKFQSGLGKRLGPRVQHPSARGGRLLNPLAVNSRKSRASVFERQIALRGQNAISRLRRTSLVRHRRRTFVSRTVRREGGDS